MAIFIYNQNHLCADDYAATVCAIKSTQLKQDRATRCVFFNARTVSVAIWQTIYFFVIRKTTFRTRKRFHNKQYPPKSKDQPFESERTHFYVRFNNSSIAMHRQTFFFFFLTKSQPFNKKPKQNYIKQPQQTIQNFSINNTLKTKHNKQTRKTISSINRKINHKNSHNKQPTQPLDKKHPKTNTTSNYEKMQCF